MLTGLPLQEAQSAGEQPEVSMLVDDAAELSDEEMTEEGPPAAGNGGRQKVDAELKEQVLAVLERNNLSGLRAAKLSQDDFMLLLSLFNKAGFHFS